MYFSEIYTIFFPRSYFHFLYLFKMWEIFMPHPVYVLSSSIVSYLLVLISFWTAYCPTQIGVLCVVL